MMYTGIMLSQFRFIFVIFSLTAVLVFTAHARVTASRVFYKFQVAHVKHNTLNAELKQKQLQLESLINPAAVSQRLEKAAESRK
jgi:hypothetical protein